MSDFDNFIRHSDFNKVLELAATLKGQQQHLRSVATQTSPSPSSMLHSRKKKKVKSEPNQHDSNGRSAIGGDQGEERPQSHRGSSFDAAELIRAALIPTSSEGSEPMTGVMGRGECLLTDSLIDETIKSLADELKMCLGIKHQLQSMSGQGSRISETSSGEAQGMNYCYGDTNQQVNWTGGRADGRGYNGSAVSASASVSGGGGGAVASKFSKWQTDILTDWMIEHREHPFPTPDEIKAIGKATNLTDTQVVNWTTNVRKRNLKATVEREKKPHHFLDYLFLATDREKLLRREHPDMADFSVGGGQDNQPAPPLFGYAPPPPLHPNFQHSHQYQPPDVHRHLPPVAPPRAPINTGEIFRRGKHLSEQFTRERERQVLAAYSYAAPHDTPPGSFEDDEECPPLNGEGIDVNSIFADNATSGKGLAGEEEGRQSKAVSFEMADVPFDECAEDYLRQLIGWA